MSEFLEYALRYAALGWPVFPLYGKHPITDDDLGFTNGSLTGTTDIDLVKRAWKKHPNRNVGIATGHQFWILDKDIQHGGAESLDRLEAEHGRLPDTLQQTTGRGGTHYFFRLIPGVTMRNSESKVAQGIDVRGKGGYIVAAPSIHPETKQSYVMDGMLEFEQQEILPAPDWLITLALGDSGDNGIKAEFKHPAGAMVEGSGRNSALFRMACSGIGKGYSPKAVEAMVRAQNSDYAEPLDEREIEQVLTCISRYPAKQLSDVGTLRRAQREYERELRISKIHSTASMVDERWHDKLIRNGKDQPENLLVNVDIALTSSPEFHSSLAFNSFTGCAVVVRDLIDRIPAGTPIEDNHIGELTAYLQYNEAMKVRPDIVGQAVELVARRNSSHPVRNYLVGLEWDNVCRVDDWLTVYMGVEDNPYTRAVGKRWLISAVARIMEPGCKADCCLVLEGPQGVGKSTALRDLASGDWYSDTGIDFNSKDSFGALQGVWIYEIGELDSYTKAETGDVKRFMSSQTDKYRAPYARRDARWPRQCVFAATVNHDEYLKDQTGNRRFWPVKTCVSGDINNAQIKLDRDQIWAEAMKLYVDQEPWYLDDPAIVELAKAEQADRVEVDAWQDPISRYVSSVTGGITTGRILDQVINKPMGQWTKFDTMRVANCLRVAGFKVSVQEREGGARVRSYYRNADDAVTTCHNL